MKIDTLQNNIEVIGDIKEFKTSIDPKNLEFITTLLSSNLYSDPEQSFIREIVSNAWDSHVEAGTTDIPVIVRFKKSLNGGSITIRDYGVGLSPKRFQEIYCNIGSSTKRESNEFIGGFGIGRYSALACSDTVCITSYYEGIAYYYIMIKNGNTITTNLISEKPTTEKNGVEVTINNIDIFYPYNKALQYIIFFPNIYIDGAADANKINSAQIKKFKYFAATTIPITSKLLLGNVLYPIEKHHLNYKAINFIEQISHTGIVIKFDIGEINITPNRESIIYNSDTIKKIEDRIMDAKTELDALVTAKISKDHTDIIEYYNNVCKPLYYDPIDDTISNSSNTERKYRVEPIKMMGVSITYKGIDLRPEAQSLYYILNLGLPNFKGVVYADKFYNKRLPWEIREHNKIKTPRLLILNAKARLTETAKIYIKEHYNQYAVITDINKYDFSQWVHSELRAYTKTIGANMQLMIDSVYQSLIDNSKKLDLNNDIHYIQYKNDFVLNNKITIKNSKEIILHIYENSYSKKSENFKTFFQAVEFIKNLKTGIILTTMDSDEKLLVTIAKLKNFIFIKARKDIVAELNKLNLKCIVDLSWILNKDPMLSIVKTLVKYFPTGINYENNLRRVLVGLNKDLKDEFIRLYEIDRTFRFESQYKNLALGNNILYDPYTEYLCKKLKNYITEYTKAEKIANLVEIKNPIIILALIMKTKAYRISGDAYNEIKQNKLLNILCKK